ncbi:MAG: hypothetical protein IKG56_01940 [Clostridia bacterium]|nr:hypothetical protein [Clostridia bacterium]
MGNYDKKYIIREAEIILEECNKKVLKNNDKNRIIKLKVINKRLKRRIIFWKVCSAILIVLFILI